MHVRVCVCVCVCMCVGVGVWFHEWFTHDILSHLLSPLPTHDLSVDDVLKDFAALDICILITMTAYTFLCLCSIIASCRLTRVRPIQLISFTRHNLLIPSCVHCLCINPFPSQAWVPRLPFLASLLLVIAAPSNFSSLQRTFVYFRSINKLLNWGHIMSLQYIWLYVMIAGNSLVIAGTALKMYLEFRCVRIIHTYVHYKYISWMNVMNTTLHSIIFSKQSQRLHLCSPYCSYSSFPDFAECAVC